MKHLPTQIYLTIKESITRVVSVKKLSTNEALLDEMARNSAQSVVGLLDQLEVEGTCPLCCADMVPTKPSPKGEPGDYGSDS